MQITNTGELHRWPNGRSAIDYLFRHSVLTGGVAIRLIKIFIAYMLTPYLRVTINGMVSYLAGKSKVDFSNIDYVTPLIIGGVAIRLILIKIS